MITEDYVSYEIAKLLKEKGFDEPTVFRYGDYPGNNDLLFAPSGMAIVKNSETQPYFYSAPTLQMAMKWLRKEHNLEIYPYHNSPDNRHNSGWWFEIIKYPNSVAEYESGIDEEVDTYEEACEAAIKYCLEKLI